MLALRAEETPKRSKIQSPRLATVSFYRLKLLDDSCLVADFERRKKLVNKRSYRCKRRVLLVVVVVEEKIEDISTISNLVVVAFREEIIYNVR